MSPRVRVETRRREASPGIQGQLTETVIFREEKVVAVLPEGDPLRYALELPASELRTITDRLAPVLARRPKAKGVLEAIIQYKEQDQP